MCRDGKGRTRNSSIQSSSISLDVRTLNEMSRRGDRGEGEEKSKGEMVCTKIYLPNTKIQERRLCALHGPLQTTGLLMHVITFCGAESHATPRACVRCCETAQRKREVGKGARRTREKDTTGNGERESDQQEKEEGRRKREQ